MEYLLHQAPRRMGFTRIADAARSGKYLRDEAREESALALLAEVTALLQTDDGDERTMLVELTTALDDVGLECVVDIVVEDEAARCGARARSDRLDAVIDLQSQRAMSQKQPIWCCREPVSRPSGAGERLNDAWTYHELAALDLDWVLSVPLLTEKETLGALTVFARPDEATFPSVALVCALAQLASNALARRRERLDMIRAVERRELAMAVVAHDLKNPLGVIVTMTRLLRAGMTRIDDPTTGLAAIERQVTQMLVLVHDLLESAVMNATEIVLNHAPCNPASLVADACDFVEPLTVPKKLTLSRMVSERAPTVIVDANRVEQVLVNLLNNAIKFTPPGGSIVIGCDAHPDGVAFHVADTGPGVHDETAEHLFEPYWHGPASTGVGLGLAIAHDIVEAHGGKIWVESAPGRGAKFVFTLPLTPR